MFVPSFTSFPTLEPEPSKRTKEDTKHERSGRETSSKSSSSKRNDSDRHRTRDSSRERHREKDKDKRRKKDKDKHKEKGKDKKRREEDRDRRYEDTPATVDDSYRIFFSDRKPDLLNIQYGGLHAGDIPKYSTLYGTLLAFHMASSSIERAEELNLTDSRTRSLLALPPNRRLVHPEENSKYTEVDGFIRLPSRRGKSKPEDTYRAITEGKDGDSTNSESDSSGGLSDDDGSDDDGNGDRHPETSQQAQIRALEQKLAQDKGSVETWLALLDVTLSSIPITSKNATRARSDITLSLLHRALTSHPVTDASPVLRIKYLKAGEDIWDDAELNGRWEEALGLGSIAIWMEWLEWRMRHNKAGLDGIMEAVTRMLSSVAFQGEDEEAELARLRVFWRTAVAVQSAGYGERAMAMFQAQLELTFKAPPHLAELPHAQVLDELEEFWDSETPRILEPGSKGWANWYQLGKPEARGSNWTTPPVSDIRDLDPYRQWALREAAAERATLFPTRSADETEDTDPYSLVLFTDIRTTLVKIKTPQARHALRLAVLSFLGLPLPSSPSGFSIDQTDVNWDDRWAMRAFSSPNHLASIMPDQGEHREPGGESIAGAVIANEKEHRESFGPTKHWGYGCISPLDIWVKGSKSRPFFWDSRDVMGVDASLILRAFSQLRGGDSDFEWDSLALAFEAASNTKNALKLSKAFLTVPRDSLEYWNAHAQLERLHGRPDGARKIYQTVLVSSQQKLPHAGLSDLWWNWAEMEWLMGNDGQAMNVVLRSVGVEASTGVGVLRAKGSLDDAVSGATEWKDRQNWLKLRALMELLAGADMTQVLAVFDAHFARLRHGEVAHESLTMSSLLFVFNYRVVLKNPMPPALLRERAEKGLEAYPSNSIILGVFLEGEKGQGVWGKVRGMLGASDGKPKDVARRMEEVWIASWEKGRWLSEMERTRSGLAAAVEHERTRASPVIWRLYLEFEIKVGQPQKAKKLLFRAISECPLVKEIYLLAFGPLRSVFDGRELQSLADLMAERGLRLHEGMEEVMEVVQRDDNEEGDNGDEEEFERARELRRLMPYH